LSRRPAASLLLALLLGAACASGGAPRAGNPAPSPAAPAVTPGSNLPAATGGDWPTYHGDAARSGVLRGGGGFGSAAPAWQSGELDADVYAAPIVAGGLVVVATERNTVYAFDASTGQARWSRQLADPVDASTLPCGGIRPVTGITSTPVADPSRGLVYAVAFQRQPQHVLYSLRLETGEVVASRAVDPPGESPSTHQLRGALTLANGYVYIAYGGLLGDCGQYHGWVVGAPVAGGPLAGYRVPCDRECGLWAPGGPTVDDGGDLWVTSGNGEPFDRFTYSNSVLRLSPDLKLRDYFAPRDWAALSRSDSDLGSISPVLLDGGLAWISGKSATGYLLRRDHLGGIGGQAFSGPVCNTYASAIADGPMVYLACPGEGRLMAVRVDASRPSFSPAWRVDGIAPGGPILAYGALWVVDTDGGSLIAVDPQSGRRLFSLAGGGVVHFVTPAAAGGRVYAVLGRRLRAVTITPA
jgi:outer membrane protein assembly factor BamB